MLTTSIFKAYDIRGIYPTDINEEAVKLVGQACVHMFDEGEVIIAYDIRHGSVELSKILEESILSEAAKINKRITVRNAGLSTTPMFYFLVNHFGSTGGCMVTASHNPKEYNGVKIVKAGASMVPGTEVLTAIQTLQK